MVCMAPAGMRTAALQPNASCPTLTHLHAHAHQPRRQARQLPEDTAALKIYSIDSHRLALALDSQGRLLPLVRSTLLGQMGFKSGDVRIQNLV